MLSINAVTARHCPSLPVIARHCPSLPVTARHCPSLPVTARHCASCASIPSLPVEIVNIH